MIDCRTVVNVRWEGGIVVLHFEDWCWVKLLSDLKEGDQISESKRWPKNSRTWLMCKSA
jgi:hypothetical protein